MMHADYNIGAACRRNGVTLARAGVAASSALLPIFNQKKHSGPLLQIKEFVHPKGRLRARGWPG
jgi:hypothetical protein